MSTDASRGDSPSGYLPGFDGASGVKMRNVNLKSQSLSGVCAADKTTYAISHQLGIVPSVILFSPRLVENDVVNSISAGVVGEAKASAATSSKVYVIGSRDGIAYRLFLMV